MSYRIRTLEINNFKIRRFFFCETFCDIQIRLPGSQQRTKFIQHFAFVIVEIKRWFSRSVQIEFNLAPGDIFAFAYQRSDRSVKFRGPGFPDRILSLVLVAEQLITDTIGNHVTLDRIGRPAGPPSYDPALQTFARQQFPEGRCRSLHGSHRLCVPTLRVFDKEIENAVTSGLYAGGHR